MANCPHMDSCRMYALFSLAGTLKVWQVNYCTASFEGCARYKLAREAKPVPDNLLPNGTQLRKEGKI